MPQVRVRVRVRLERLTVSQVEYGLAVDGDDLPVGHVRVAGGGARGEDAGENDRLLVRSCAHGGVTAG